MTKVYHNNIKLKCPYCGDFLDIKYFKSDKYYQNWGVCKCLCDEYPIIEGIFYLIKDDNFSNKKAVRFLNEKKYFNAINTVLVGTPKVQKLILVLYYLIFLKFNIKFNLINVLLILRVFSRSQEYKNWIKYNIQRKTYNSYLTPAIHFCKFLKDGDILLDIGCGFGIFTDEFLTIPKYKNILYFGIDKNFSTLLTNKYFNSHQTNLICADSNFLIPFQSKSINKILVLDTITNIHSVKNLIKECHRVLTNNGFIAIVNIYKINKKSFLWGYGINPLFFESIIKKYFRKITYFENKLSSSKNIAKINKLKKNTFSYSCYATRKN